MTATRHTPAEQQQPASGPGSGHPGGPGGPGAVMRLMFGAVLQQALYVAAKLAVADELAGGPLLAGELAARVDAAPDALARFLRGLASAGVFTEPSPGMFALNAAAEFLRSDVPGSHRDIVILHGEETYAAGVDVLHTARTGRPAFEKTYGEPYFDYLATHPEARAVFDAAMGRGTEFPAVVDQADFRDATLLVDVGGGSGAFAAAALSRTRGLRAVVFDLPPAVVGAAENLARLGVADRVEVVGGDGFTEVPAGGDLYTIVRVLHDFDDEQATAMLDSVRRAIAEHGRLLVFDALLADRPGFSPGRMADLVMLTVLGGRYRTEVEMRALIEASGFEVVSVRTPDGDPRAESVLEAVPI
jgi:16S rRNA G966 N2-methylase RsmD